MKAHVPIWLAALGCLGSLVLGAAAFRGTPVRAQAAPPEVRPKPEEPATLTEYPYLPNRYGEAYIPSFAEWQAIRVTALGASTTRITEQFSRQQLTCFATPKGLVLTLDLIPQPGWKYFVGGKLWSPSEAVPDLQKAVDATMQFLRRFFSEVRDRDVTIQVFIRSERIGEWKGGKLTLLGASR